MEQTLTGIRKYATGVMTVTTSTRLHRVARSVQRTALSVKLGRNQAMLNALNAPIKQL